MAQSNIRKKTAAIVSFRRGSVATAGNVTDASGRSSRTETLGYVADMAEGLADMADDARGHEVADLLRAAVREARRDTTLD